MEVLAHICIVGLGNPLRGDDGIGHHLCGLVEGLALTGVHTIRIHQLDTSILPELVRYDQLVVMDAALQDEPVVFTDTEDTVPSANLSHHLQPAIIRGLLKKLFRADVKLKILRVRGYEFGYGTPISQKGLANAASAFDLLKTWLLAQRLKTAPSGE